MKETREQRLERLLVAERQRTADLEQRCFHQESTIKSLVERVKVSDRNKVFATIYKAQLKEMVEVLKMCEWARELYDEGSPDFCLVCGQIKENGHTQDCKLRKLIINHDENLCSFCGENKNGPHKIGCKSEILEKYRKEKGIKQ